MIARRLMLAGAFSLVMASQAADKVTSYDVRGVIQELRPEKKEMIIRHETIPGYMDAMVMPFSVRDAALFQQVAVGDSVAFKLKVTAKEDWMEDLKVTARGKKPEAPAKGVPTVKPGEVLSFKGIKLVDQNGRAFDLEETRGKTVVLTFFFTRCPFPKMCPLLADKFAAVQKALAAQGAQDTLLLSITIDPAHDRPDALLRYASHYQANVKYWQFATGEMKDISRLGLLCGADFWEDSGLINHALRTLVISPAGEVQRVYADNEWSPEQLVRVLGASLTR